MATLILAVGGLILVLAGGIAAPIVGALLLAVALWRVTAGRRPRNDNTPITRSDDRKDTPR